MTKQVHGQTGAHAPLSRRDFLTRAGLTVGAAAAAAAVPGAAYAVQEGVIGDWAADGSKAVDVPDSAVTNASWSVSYTHLERLRSHAHALALDGHEIQVVRYAEQEVARPLGAQSAQRARRFDLHHVQALLLSLIHI